MVFGLPWGGLGEFLAPLGCPWASLGPLLARFGGAWEASWRSLGSLEVPLGPRPPKDHQNGAPGDQNDKNFEQPTTQILENLHPDSSSKSFPATPFAKGNPSKFFKIRTRFFLQSCSLQRLSQRETLEKCIDAWSVCLSLHHI